jgi:hypothetical protein
LKGELLSPKKPIHTHDDLCAVAAAALLVAGAVSAVAVWSALAVRFIVAAKRSDIKRMRKNKFAFSKLATTELIGQHWCPTVFVLT